MLFDRDGHQPRLLEMQALQHLAKCVALLMENGGRVHADVWSAKKAFR